MLSFFTYSIPFAKPFTTANATYKNRDGIIIGFQEGDYCALGEAAPLPSFSTETLAEACKQLKEHRQTLTKMFTDPPSAKAIYAFNKKQNIVASLRCALYSLCSNIHAQNDDHQSQTKNRSIAVNAVLSSNNLQKNERIRMLHEEGFRTLKLKVDGDTSTLIPALEAIRNQFPDINLRLDANQSWSISQALGVLAKAAPYTIEYCEEPIETPTPERIKRIQQASPIPIALDESIGRQLSFKKALQRAPFCIIKPMMLDHLNFRAAWNDLPPKKRPTLIYTTALDATPGRLHTAKLAYKYGSKSHAHGVATGSLFADDLLPNQSFISGGRFQIPSSQALSKLSKKIIASSHLQPLE